MKIRNMLANDKFMSALGIAFIISFLCGMTDMLSKRYVSGTVSVIEGLADLFRNINACFYPSALAVVIIEWLHNNERLNLCVGDTDCVIVSVLYFGENMYQSIV